MASRQARISWRDAARETTASYSLKSGYVGILGRGSSDANSTLGANKHMQAEFRPRRRDLELVALYRRRTAVLSLIRSLERYQRVRVRRIQACPRRQPLAAV
jgi:hypothetical protein